MQAYRLCWCPSGAGRVPQAGPAWCPPLTWFSQTRAPPPPEGFISRGAKLRLFVLFFSTSAAETQNQPKGLSNCNIKKNRVFSGRGGARPSASRRRAASADSDSFKSEQAHSSPAKHRSREGAGAGGASNVPGGQQGFSGQSVALGTPVLARMAAGNWAALPSPGHNPVRLTQSWRL